MTATSRRRFLASGAGLMVAGLERTRTGFLKLPSAKDKPRLDTSSSSGVLSPQLHRLIDPIQGHLQSGTTKTKFEFDTQRVEWNLIHPELPGGSRQGAFEQTVGIATPTEAETLAVIGHQKGNVVQAFGAIRRGNVDESKIELFANGTTVFKFAELTVREGGLHSVRVLRDSVVSSEDLAHFAAYNCTCCGACRGYQASSAVCGILAGVICGISCTGPFAAVCAIACATGAAIACAVADLCLACGVCDQACGLVPGQKTPCCSGICTYVGTTYC